MELRHLRTIAAVARHGSFTRAAQELFLAQSAISQQIKRFEDELGVTVFRRTSRRVEVTEEGQVILATALRVLAEVDALQVELEERSNLLRGRLSLGAMHPTGPFDLPGLLATYRKRHPGVAIHMVEEVADDMLTLLRRDELDCAFASVDTDGIGEEFAATLLWQEELVVAAHPAHPFAAQEAVTLEQLAAEPLIAYRENSAMRQRLERVLGGVGLRPEPAFVCTEMGAVRALASNGLGVAVMPRSVTEQPGPAVVARPLGPTPLTWPVALVWRAARRQPPAAKAFLALALAAAPAAAAGPVALRVA